MVASADAKPGGNPREGERSLGAETLGDFDFVRVAFAVVSQFSFLPADFGEFLGNDAFGSLEVSFMALGGVVGRSDWFGEALEYLVAELLEAIVPAATDGGVSIGGFGVAVFFGRLFEVGAGGRGVFEDIHIAEESVGVQPLRALVWAFEVVGKTAPAIVTQGLIEAQDASASGVEMDVIANDAEVISMVGVHQQGFIAAAEEVTKEVVAAVEAGGVGAKEPTHPCDEVGLGRFDDQMEVVTHEAIGVDLPVGFCAGFYECVQKKLAVTVIPKDVFATVTAVEDVIGGVLEFDAQLTWHQKIMPE